MDVGALPAPRPRTIYLQPISKRSKKKRPAGSTVSAGGTAITADGAGESSSDFDSTRAVETSTEGSLVADDANQDAHQNPRSPVNSDLRSEVSGDSAVSGSTGLSSRERADPNQSGSLGTVQAGVPRKSVSSKDKTITTTIELVKSGCLPGDTISVKVDVQHTKRIKSLYGVIVTLYRQGRVDSAPPVALFKNISKEEQRRLEKEEYYPKSKTGLGGLSLSSAGTCSVFRKDLSQAFSPLIIDPATLTASVTTSVRVPENSFPSIRGVPGEMISFKYRLEVIVDLGGKLANAIQIQQNPRVGPAAGVLTSGREGAAGLASFDGSLVNTDPLKREKGVIYDSFELVVGTTDTSRRGKAVSSPSNPGQDGAAYNENGAWPAGWEDEGYGAEEAYPQEYVPYPGEPAAQYPYWNGGSQEPADPAPHYIPPPPDFPDESGLSEKERVRRAEQRLLPSQPQAPAPVAGPSAPAAHGGGDDDEASPSAPSAPSAPPPLPPTEAAPSAPTLDDLAAGSSGPNGSSTDDKQELERQRLLAEASAPPEFPVEDDAGVGSSSAPSAPPMVDGPSAPILTEEEEYGTYFAHQAPVTSSEPLPAYQR